MALTQDLPPGPGRVPSGQHVRCRRCTAAVFEGEQQQIWKLAQSNPTSYEQVFKRLVNISLIHNEHSFIDLLKLVQG
jgi:hypothetical protein